MSSPLLRRADFQKAVTPSKKQAPDYFAFRSNPLSPASVRKMVEKYGSNLMIGVDPTYAGNESTVRAARKGGARLHVYLEGPGGPTGDPPPGSGVWGGWGKEERARITAAARRQGINPNTPEGMKKWNEYGWKQHTFAQMKDYKSKGFESAEIDNLYRGLGSSPKKLVGFYQEYAEKFKAGDMPTLMMKNIDKKQMAAVAKAVENGQLPREMFSDFAIWETSAGPLNGQQKLAASMGIRTVVSSDTHNYGAQGKYGLR